MLYLHTLIQENTRRKHGTTTPQKRNPKDQPDDQPARLVRMPEPQTYHSEKTTHVTPTPAPISAAPQHTQVEPQRHTTRQVERLPLLATATVPRKLALALPDEAASTNPPTYDMPLPYEEHHLQEHHDAPTCPKQYHNPPTAPNTLAADEKLDVPQYA